MFKKSDLLPDYRTPEVFTIIKNMADRVVRVIGPSATGSGIILKANGEFYLQTCAHAIIETCAEHDQGFVLEGTQCKTCNYKSRVCDRVGVVYKNRSGYVYRIDKKGTKLVANCESREKAIFAVTEVPKFIKEKDMEDFGWLVVNIRIYGSVTWIKGLLEFHQTESSDQESHSSKFIIHSAQFIEKGTECDIVFNNKTETRCTGIEQCCKHCSCLTFDQQFVPIEAKNYFYKGLPWETKDKQQVVVISFPEEKEIIFGEPIVDPHIDDCLIPCEQINTPSGVAPLKKVVFLKHNASVRAGFSGGCVLIIGKDAESCIGYKSYMCMHIAGNDKHGISSIGLIN
ncbi:hypothetical protein SNE40_006021 [Patella caerulea]|uniref:Uncharacterized protein n=1 Tax=Patella caerulea TaxID=87958 RepID=A0AAN8K752_PATCE